MGPSSWVSGWMLAPLERQGAVTRHSFTFTLRFGLEPSQRRTNAFAARARVLNPCTSRLTGAFGQLGRHRRQPLAPLLHFSAAAMQFSAEVDRAGDDQEPDAEAAAGARVPASHMSCGKMFEPAHALTLVAPDLLLPAVLTGPAQVDAATCVPVPGTCRMPEAGCDTAGASCCCRRGQGQRPARKALLVLPGSQALLQ